MNGFRPLSPRTLLGWTLALLLGIALLKLAFWTLGVVLGLTALALRLLPFLLVGWVAIRLFRSLRHRTV